jgi:hypothetical protein
MKLTYINGTEVERKDFCNKIYFEAIKQSQNSFSVIFEPVKKEKSFLQLKGIHKLCQIYQEYISEAFGNKISFENAKENLKYEINYLRFCNADEAMGEALRIKRQSQAVGKKMTIKELDQLALSLQSHYQVPKSFSDATLEEMTDLIEKVHEIGRNRGWHNLVLTNEEKQQMTEYFNNNKTK